MGIRAELEILAVLLLLTPLVSDGLVIPKCEVVDQLMSTIPADVPDHDTLVAEIACHAEVTSNFNTSLVKQVSSPGFFGSRKARSTAKKSAPKTNTPPKTTNPPAKPTTNPPAKPTTNPLPKTTKNLNAQTTTLPPKYQNVTHEPMINQTEPTMPPQYNHSHTNPPSNHSHTNPPSNHSHTNPPSNHSNTDPPFDHSHTDPPFNHSQTTDGMPLPPPPNYNFSDLNSRKKRDAGGLWTLYGVFQLADRFACISPGKPSLNICNLSCDKLIDDDITDDINCVLTIINNKPNINTNPVGQDQSNRLIPPLKGMILNTCPKKDYTQYLAQCNNQ